MKAPLEWLSEYVDLPPDLDELVQRLIMSGTEVEEIIRPSEHWQDVVVGLVQTVEVPPGSKHLSVVSIDIGTRTIVAVTGAPNIAAGQRVPVVLIGGTVPVGPEGEPFVLQPRKMMGITGEGMVLSERELGMSGEHGGILVLSESAAVGSPLSDVIGGVVIDVEAKGRTDELAILGVAREIAAVIGAILREPDRSRPDALMSESSPSAVIKVEAPDLCPRFSCVRISGIKIAHSPEWLARRLEAAGVRAINNVVDVTNYVMLELGQPLHAYDYDKVPEGTLIVRRAKSGETIVTLDGVTRALDGDMLLVADVNGPSGIAGIMGAGHSEVTDETTSVLLEGAGWDRVNLRRSGRRLGLRTEASGRFERGVPPELTVIALARCLNLFGKIMDGPLTTHDQVDVVGELPELAEIRFRTEQIERLLGDTVPPEQCVDSLRRLGFEVTESGNEIITRPPFWRRDIESVADITEEVARMIGYDHVPESLPGQETPPVPLPPDLRWESAVRRVLLSLGVSEAWTDSLVAPESPARLLAAAPSGAADWKHIALNPEGVTARGAAIEPVYLANAPSRERSTLRLSLIPSLLDVAVRNLKHTRERVAFFEIARTFFPRTDDLPYERRTLGIVLAGDRELRGWNRPQAPYDFFDVKGIVEAVLRVFLGGQIDSLVIETPDGGTTPALHPARAAVIRISGDTVGHLGELHPLVAEKFEIASPVRGLVAEIDLDAVIAHAVTAPPVHRPASRFPAVKRDISLMFPSTVAASEIERVVAESGGELLHDVRIVDVYEDDSLGAGCRSISLALEFQSETETLTQETVSSVQDGIVEKLNQLGGVLRA